MRNTIRFVAIAVLALLVTSGSRSRDTVYAQAKPVAPVLQDQGRPDFRVSVDLITTDMIPRDQKNDQFIADLKPEEIEIYEDGVKQKIASIELVHGGRAYSVIAPPPAPVQEGIILPRNKPTNDTAGRVFIIFIDDLHLDFRQTPRTRKLLQDMLKNLIHDGDMFGITPPARRRCRFSSPTTGRCSTPRCRG